MVEGGIEVVESKEDTKAEGSRKQEGVGIAEES